MLRLIAIFPFLCAIAALVLSLLCIFAGSKAGFLENADIMTLNTSRLGVLAADNSSSGILSTIEGDLQGLLSDATGDLAKVLNIHDFYSLHILDYCEGFYSPEPIRNATVHPTKNITKCSKKQALFTFNPQQVLQSELKPGVQLSDLKFPDEIQNAITTLEVAMKAMFILYCIAVAFSGLAVLGAIFGLFGGRLSAFLNIMLDFMAFLSILLASILSTVIASKATNAVNQYGNPIGIAATKGNEFLGFTWAATGVMLLASIAWIFECIVGRKRHTAIREGEKRRL
ncbi:hypothetical protein MMC25_001929 [Agyrium rufum]|nr:hypothetical protein [Agyrium rufum]